MITITRQNDGVLFEFEDSKKYLYGNGSILVPFNTLSIVADESDMITLKKAASNDVFLSARYDTDLGYRSKDDAIDDLKDLLFAETGGGSESGITSGEVQTMIDNSLEDYYTDDEVDAALSGKADTSDVTAVANDVQTVSGQVATKVAISDFNAYSAATDARIAEDEEVTAAALNNLDETKQDALVYYSEDAENKEATITVEDTDFTSTTTFNSTTIDLSVESDDSGTHYIGYATVGDAGIQMAYDKMTGSDETDAHSNLNVEDGIISAEVYANEETTTVEIASTGVTINGEDVATEAYVDAATSGKADTSAVTTVSDALTSHTANTTVHVTAAEKAEWNDKAEVIELTQAQYDALVTKDPDVLYVISDAAPAEVIITTTITSSSTNGEAASAKAVYDFVGGLKMVKMTSAEYQALATKDANTVYFVGDATNGYTMKLGEANIN